MYNLKMEYAKLDKENLDAKLDTENLDPKLSKKILFYTGISDREWNLTISLEKALGGSETAVAYLSCEFPKDYEIYICGLVKEENIGNIHYVHHRDLKELINNNIFHTIIVSRYIRFFELYPNFISYKIFIWAHDIELTSFGSKLSVYEILDKWHHKINACICLTQYHKEEFKKYKMIYDKIIIINNGIKLDLFNNLNIEKVKNRFVYTSCPERGLQRLLDIWPDILQYIPNAELKIASYRKLSNYDNSYINKINQYPSIEYIGSLNPDALYKLIKSSEYWLYPSFFEETSCITSLEMLNCNVICLYYDKGGIKETINNNGFIITLGNEVEQLLALSDNDKYNTIINGKIHVNKCSWENKYKEWEKIIF
jgi:glycosyltransferase involved in cell wall biosynthesis